MLRGVGLSDEAGYYFNTVSCFPGGPPPTESVSACRLHLRRQLDFIPARFILACGAIALSALAPRMTLKHVTGLPFDLHGHTIVPIYHPSFILRQRGGKDGSIETAWREDLSTFGALVNGVLSAEDVWETHEFCAYQSASCTGGRMRISGEVTCKFHRRTIQADSAWKDAYVQPGLF